MGKEVSRLRYRHGLGRVRSWKHDGENGAGTAVLGMTQLFS